jgi:hypothetical protein
MYIASLRASLRALTLAVLLGSGAGCYESSSVLGRDGSIADASTDGGAPAPDARGADADGIPDDARPGDAGGADTGTVRRPDGGALDGAGLDIRVCESAPMLALDVRYRDVSVEGIERTRPDGCWSGSTFRRGYVRVSLPPHTGFEIRVEGATLPILNITDGCAPPATGGECSYYGPSGFAGPDDTERVHYVGNASDEPWELVVSFSWGDGWPIAPFDLVTRSFDLPVEASCEGRIPLEPGVLAPGAPGGFSFLCGWHRSWRFYTIEVPSMHRAVPLEGSDFLWGTADCSHCEPVSGDEGQFYWTLENLGATARTATLMANGPTGFRLEPMPESAGCATAPPLVLDGPPVSVDMDFAGHPAIVCEAESTDGAHYFRVTAPAGATIVVRAELDEAGPEQRTTLWARDECGDTACVAVSSERLGATSTELVLGAPGAERTWVIGLALGALPAPDQIARLSVRIRH